MVEYKDVIRLEDSATFLPEKSKVGQVGFENDGDFRQRRTLLSNNTVTLHWTPDEVMWDTITDTQVTLSKNLQILSHDSAYDGGLRIIADSSHYAVVALGCDIVGSGSQDGQWNIMRAPTNADPTLDYKLTFFFDTTEVAKLTKSGEFEALSVTNYYNYCGNSLIFTDTAGVIKMSNDNSGITFLPDGDLSFVNGAATCMVIKTNGAIGIGTTNPLVKLQVEGNIRSYTSSSGSASFEGYTTGRLINCKLGSYNSDDAALNLYLADGTSETVRLNSNGVSFINGGSVGIGTTNPSKTLHVVGTALISTALYVPGPIYTEQLRTDTVDGSDNSYISICGGGAAGGSRGATITVTGNEEASYHGDMYLTAGAGNGSITGAIKLVSHTYTNTRPTNDYSWDQAFGKYFTIKEVGGDESLFLHNAYYNAGWKYRETDGASAVKVNIGDGFVVQTATNGTKDDAITWHDSLNITKNGNVYIGTSGDKHKLEVQGNIVISDKVGIGSTAAPTESLEVTGMIRQAGCFAEIHVHDASAAQAIANGTTYVKLTCYDHNGHSSNCTADQANDKITFTKTGYYRVSGSFSFSCGTNNTTFFITAFLDGVEQDNIHCERKIATGGDKGNASFTGIVDVTSAPLDLDVRVRHDGGSSVDITVFYSNLNVEYLGNT